MYTSSIAILTKEAINFYLQPVVILEDPAQPWFTTVPVGRNALAKLVQDIFADVGISGNKANHSLRATGAKELYNAGVLEK